MHAVKSRWEIVAVRRAFQAGFVDTPDGAIAKTPKRGTKQAVLNDLARITGHQITRGRDGFMWVPWQDDDTGVLEIRDLILVVPS